MRIDGKKIASKILEELKTKVEMLKKKNLIPHLVVILIGSDPASISYVNQKEIRGKRIGVKITVKNLPTNITQSKLLKTIEQFNNDNNTHGIIVQRPLPKNIDSKLISLAIDPKKDVDGFHPNSKFHPPIALAVIKTLEKIFARILLREGVSFKQWLKTKNIVILGKGETGGRLIIQLFKQMNIKPQVIDSKTKNPASISKTADIIISAVGKPNVVKPEMLKKGIILIGVGLHRGNDGKLHGDYDEKKIKNIASFYTPTPGGVGPLNVAMLLENLIKAAKNQSSQVSS